MLAGNRLIFCQGSDDSDAETLQTELVYFLTKPFTVGVVQQVVRSALPSLGASS